MKLTVKDIESPLWRKLEAHFKESLERSRMDLEKKSNTTEQTFVLRGKIELTRQLLKVGDRQNILGLGDETNNEHR